MPLWIRDTVWTLRLVSTQLFLSNPRDHVPFGSGASYDILVHVLCNMALSEIAVRDLLSCARG